MTVLLSYTEVAKALNLTPSSVKRLCAEGRIPSIRLSERLIRIPKDSLERFIASRENREVKKC
jgi:excisionase family DNA binding protein